MKEVAVYEAKIRLSELLVRVESGERVLITRRGVPVAQLVAPPAGGADAARSQRERVAGALTALKRHRKNASLGVPLRDAIEDGRD
jgi:prevent-host-death family protein